MTSEELKNWRLRFGFTQSQAAAELGCSRRAFQNWETGVAVPKYIALACSAVAMGLPPYGATERSPGGASRRTPR